MRIRNFLTPTASRSRDVSGVTTKLEIAGALAGALLITCGSAFAQAIGLIDAANLNGHEVYDFNGKKLGDLQQILVDPVSGRTRYAVLQVDKAWDLNDPEMAVPWGAFKITKDGDEKLTFSLGATKERLERAPRYKVGDADRLYTREAGKPIYSYWELWWIEEPPTPESNSTPPNEQATPPAEESETPTEKPTTPGARP